MSGELLQAHALIDRWNRWKNESRNANSGLKFNQNAQKFWLNGIACGMKMMEEQLNAQNEFQTESKNPV